MNKIDTTKWKEFSIFNVFKTIDSKNKQVPTGASVDKKNLQDGNTPRITVTNLNNGIIGYYDCCKTNPNYRVYENFISVSFLGTVFYHNYAASLDMKVHCLQLKNYELNRFIGCFLVSIIRETINKFDYSDQISSKVLASLKIKLPADEAGNPNFAYMETYMQNLETRVSTDLVKLGSVEKSKNIYLDIKEWKIFSFRSIFNRIEQGKRLTKADQRSGNIPFVMAGVTNTGIVNYIANPVAVFPKNSITIDIFGNTFYRDYEFGAGDDTGVYWSTEREYSKETMLFFATAMKKALAEKFSFDKKLRSSQSLDLTFKLPVDTKGNPDYVYMDTFIKQKLTQTQKQLHYLV